MSSLLLVASVSKVPFYIAGGVLAVWAVVLAALGLSRPAFPGNGGGARAVMAISFVLMAVTIAMAVHTSTFEPMR
ncbi:MAG: hypothetical protein ACYDHH_10770 [Solirubrobacteraceae bacterium]